MRRFLLIPHLHLLHANAMSSPFTIGFPAMTAWLGATHALQRTLQRNGWPTLHFKHIAISSHDCDLQTYKGEHDFIHSIIGTANPLDKDGDRPAFIEEARCHLDVSLLVECEHLEGDQENAVLEAVQTHIPTMKWASGDVHGVGRCQILHYDPNHDTAPSTLRRICNKLMPGYVLIERRDLIIQAMQEEQADALDAVLDYLKVRYLAEQDDSGKVTWTAQRKAPGWLVPIAVGFQGISALGQAQNQRDAHTPHRFAEAVVTLGEFVMPYRITNIDRMLWHYHTQNEPDVYLCCNQSL